MDTTSPQRMLHHVLVHRPRREVFQRWLDVAPRLDAGFTRVARESPLTSTWEMRTLGWPRRLRIDLLEWRPPSRIRWRSEDASIEGAVSFTDVNRDLTAVRVDVSHRPRTPAEHLAARVGLTSRRWDRALRRFASWVESRPRIGSEPDVPRPDPSPLPPPTEVGVPHHLGVVDETDGSPGGRGSMGLTSDDMGAGGSVGPADVAGVPPVYP